jgi:hypothetical protein
VVTGRGSRRRGREEEGVAEEEDFPADRYFWIYDEHERQYKDKEPIKIDLVVNL